MNIQDRISINSPLSGILMPLSAIPDPVFSEKMLGDGVAIDPTDNILYSPVNGRVTMIHTSGHAITVRCEDGTEVLMHVGIDTVKLNGEGFNVLVTTGSEVSVGQKLIEFDLDLLATKATSLITPILILNNQNEIKLTQASVTVGGLGSIFSLNRMLNQTELGINDDSIATSFSDESSTSKDIKIKTKSGIHARPSAVIVNCTKKFKADIQIIKNTQKENAKSVVGIMSLELGQGDTVSFKAIGSDCVDAIVAIESIMSKGFDEHEEKVIVLTEKVSLANEDKNTFAGIPASPGSVVGTVFQVSGHEIDVVDVHSVPSVEKKSFELALQVGMAELESIRLKLSKQGSADRAAIFSAHLELLDDPDLINECMEKIENSKSAAFAWKESYTNHANRLEKLNNELFAARASDLKDVGQRVLKILVGETAQTKIIYPENVILIAESLTPSDTAGLDKTKVLGFATTTGGTTSHVAILARSLGIAAVAGINIRALDINNGEKIILDGDKGVIKLNITEGDIKELESKQRFDAQEKATALAEAFKSANTTDGAHIEVAANIAGTNDASDALKLGCDGVGLLRSEFLFLERSSAPSENDQLLTYQGIADALSNKDGRKKFIIRTLDVGGDKPLAYMPIPKEENPFLGERGIRVSLNNPEVFRTQLRAILRVKPLEQVRIMFPMVSSIVELREAKNILNEEKVKLGLANIKVEVGIMIEVPSAAIMAEQLAAHVDFFSIGANDLTQYTLAMDRGHHKLAGMADGLHPSVLRLIKMTCDGAKKHNKWVGVCGGIASELPAIPILLGLGITELSVSVPVLPMVKSQVRKYSLEQCIDLANKAMNLETGKDVRNLVALVSNEKVSI